MKLHGIYGWKKLTKKAFYSSKHSIKFLNITKQEPDRKHVTRIWNIGQIYRISRQIIDEPLQPHD